MSNDPVVDTRSGARSTRLGLVAMGFAIGVIVAVITLWILKIRF